MRPLTNFDLLEAAILVAMLLTTVAGAKLLWHADATPWLVGTVVVLAAFGTRIDTFVRRRLNANSVWRQPVSDRTGAMVLNAATATWLAFVALISTFMLVLAHGSVASVLALCVGVVGTIVVGTLLRRRFWPGTLLGYGVSALATFVLVLVTALAFVQR